MDQWIRIIIPNPDPLAQLNPDPILDPKHCSHWLNLGPPVCAGVLHHRGGELVPGDGDLSDCPHAPRQHTRLHCCRYQGTALVGWVMNITRALYRYVSECFVSGSGSEMVADTMGPIRIHEGKKGFWERKNKKILRHMPRIALRMALVALTLFSLHHLMIPKLIFFSAGSLANNWIQWL